MAMPAVELVYDGDCPNVADVRAQLLRAFAQTKIAPRWQEWLIDDADSPAHVRGWGSPTILVDGRDVDARGNGAGASCRLYVQRNGSLRGAPSAETIAAALGGNDSGDATSRSQRQSWRLNLAMVPGIGAALLPKLACPACWPAYAGFLTSLGLGFLTDASYLLPLTALFLAVALGALAYRARTRRGYKPLLVGLVAASIVLVGKFTFVSEPTMYAGLGLLIGASVWNTWPRRREAPACPECVAADTTPTFIRRQP